MTTTWQEIRVRFVPLSPGGDRFRVRLTDPAGTALGVELDFQPFLSEEDYENLRWYLEEYMELPDGGAVQDAGVWWDVICDAARRGLASGAVDASAIVAVSITGQWASTVPTAEDGAPAGDCISSAAWGPCSAWPSWS